MFIMCESQFTNFTLITGMTTTSINEFSATLLHAQYQVSNVQPFSNQSTARSSMVHGGLSSLEMRL